jgi:hypothetical protein
MEKAAALALAASILNQLHETYVHYLVDNQLLVNFTNGVDLFDPPDWRTHHSHNLSELFLQESLHQFTEFTTTKLDGILTCKTKFFHAPNKSNRFLKIMC